ncbi:MAG TPA: type II toxin-antitoxin system Phd/YefM family antitoxin [Stellaceae bacterium]|nr:type II toxin-antitoxin system Phd/YefM family antitoxin [Stellaceae bacterium]
MPCVPAFARAVLRGPASQPYPGDFPKLLETPPADDILVRMTRAKKNPPGRWPLQDAKARFSELVRRVHSDGPQLVTVHGRDEVVVMAVEEFRRLKGDRTGAALIAALQASPYRDIEIESRRERLPVRDVKL